MRGGTRAATTILVALLVAGCSHDSKSAPSSAGGIAVQVPGSSGGDAAKAAADAAPSAPKCAECAECAECARCVPGQFRRRDVAVGADRRQGGDPHREHLRGHEGRLGAG